MFLEGTLFHFATTEQDIKDSFWSGFLLECVCVCGGILVKCLQSMKTVLYQPQISCMYMFSEFVHLLVIVADISVKVWQRRRRFIAHTLRQDPNNDCHVELTWNTKGKKKEKTKNNIDCNGDEINGLAILLG